MTDFNQRITFCQLLVKYRRIEVPLIQRDYAQGRETEKDVRDDFLKALQGALGLPAGDPKLPLNLDFVYGSMESGSSGGFLPLDGQQRLTRCSCCTGIWRGVTGSIPNSKACCGMANTLGSPMGAAEQHGVFR